MLSVIFEFDVLQGRRLLQPIQPKAAEDGFARVRMATGFK